MYNDNGSVHTYVYCTISKNWPFTQLNLAIIVDNVAKFRKSRFYLLSKNLFSVKNKFIYYNFVFYKKNKYRHVYFFVCISRTIYHLYLAQCRMILQPYFVLLSSKALKKWQVATLNSYLSIKVSLASPIYTYFRCNFSVKYNLRHLNFLWFLSDTCKNWISTLSAQLSNYPLQISIFRSR